MSGAELRSGELWCTIDLDRGVVTAVHHGRERVAYRVYAAYRDARWGTPTPTLSHVERSGNRAQFIFDYGREIGILGSLTVHVTQTQMTVEYRASITHTVKRNRLGLCLLLPISLAGAPATVITDSGRRAFEFPKRISPHQPCGDLRGIEFAMGGCIARFDFQGDLFEMEDQRNWTDFSYKVYCTPLARPVPVTLTPGTVVEQRITLTVASAPDGENVRAATSDEADARTPARLPLIGTRRLGAPPPDVDIPVEYLRHELGATESPSPHRVPLHIYSWSATPDGDGVHEPGDRGTSANPHTAALAAIVGRPSLVGTDGAFAELNRSRPPASPGGDVVFTISPQVHDVDDDTLIDNLLGVRDAMESARAIYPETPIGIGLLELTPHFNPAAGDRETNARRRRKDPRIADGFGLAWLFAALCELAASGARFVTVLDEAGPHGFVRGNTLIPAAHLLYDVASIPADRSVEVHRRADARSDAHYAMTWAAGDERVTLAANLSPAPWRLSALHADRMRIVTRAYQPVEAETFEEHRVATLVPAPETIELPPVSYLYAGGDL